LEEVGEVEAKDGGLGDVGSDKGKHGAAGAEAVGGGIQDAGEELALDGLETGFGGGEEAETAGGLGVRDQVVIGEVVIGKPGELGGGDDEVVGERGEIGQGRGGVGRWGGYGRRGGRDGSGGECGDGGGFEWRRNR